MKEGIFIGILVIILVGLGYFVDAIECKQKAKALGYNYNYGIIEGCVVEKDGKKALLEQLRTFE